MQRGHSFRHWARVAFARIFLARQVVPSPLWTRVGGRSAAVESGWAATTRASTGEIGRRAFANALS
eukprot:2706732-Prymnesium_polylepis.2